MSLRRLLPTGLIVALAACSGPDTSAFEDFDTTPTPVTVLAPADPTTTTMLQPSTTTAPSTTTEIESTTSTTIAAPATTSTSEEDLVRAAIEARRVKETDCLRDPASCDPSAFAARDHLISVRQRAVDYAASGFYLGDGPVPLRYDIHSVSVDGPNASATACIFDPLVVFGPSLPDGTPVVINDLQLSKEVRFELVKDGGKWFVSRVDVLGTEIAGDVCVA